MVRVIGIDPGINNCGIALCSYDTDKDILTRERNNGNIR